ncbi:200 kDa antigen p200, putative [Burkholderia pseudomallei 1710b]|uniref:200 kDa antigen p200, putative n=1 Tax=Burkholderia pseudomallei (strain 1710b) TaxID=320372 RepID=Q3JV76_BURP1|nr:200 kDa antigen p200, putative [Burkholderia pseudomallei 1710b]
MPSIGERQQHDERHADHHRHSELARKRGRHEHRADERRARQAARRMQPHPKHGRGAAIARPKAQMRDENHQPREQRAEHRDRHQQRERGLRIQRNQHGRDRDPARRHGERRERHAVRADAPEHRGREPRAGEAEHHPRRHIQLAVHRRQRGDEHDEIDDARRIRHVRRGHHLDERALVGARLRPRHDREHQREREQIEQHETKHGRPKRARHRALRIARLARRDRDGFDAHIAENRDNHRDPHAREAFWKKAAVRRIVREADAGRHGRRRDEVRAKRDERDDRGDLQHREHVFDDTVKRDARHVHRDQHGREADDPIPAGHARIPVLHEDGDRAHLGADREHHGRPVRIADEKARERADVVLGIRAERAGGRMRDRHLGERAHQQQRDQRADRIRHQHARPGEADRETAAEKQPRADRAADRDHRHLSRREPAPQALLAFDDRVERPLLLCQTRLLLPYLSSAANKTKRRGRLPAPFMRNVLDLQLFDFDRLFVRLAGRRRRLVERQQHLVVLVDVDRHVPAVDELAEQQLVGERAPDRILDQPLHRSRAHQRIEAVLREMLAQRIGEERVDLLLVQLLLELDQELVDHPHDDFLIERTEADRRIEPVAELGREQALDVCHLVAGFAPRREADRRLLHRLRTRVRRHDDDDVAEIRLAAVVVRQRAVIHHLQQHVEDVRMRLLDLVEQQHAVRLLRDGLGQQAALVEPDVSGRRADQAAHRVTLHVFRHVEADQLDAERERQLARHFGLADARRAGEQERADRLVELAEARARHLDRGGERVDRRVLAEHDALQIAVERLQLAAVVLRHALRRHARDLRDDFLDLALADRLLLLGFRQHALRGARFVDHVDRLVGQMAVGDEPRRQFGGRRQRARRILDAVMLLEARLQAAQDRDRLLDARLGHVDLLEAPRQRRILLEDAAIFGKRRRANALERARRQRRLQQVRRIERAARRGARADQRVDLVDEEYRVRPLLQLLQHRLQTLLEIAAVLRAREERAHVERIHLRVREDVRHLAARDPVREAFGDRRLADARLADEERIVLAAAAEHLHDALDLGLAPDQRIDAPVLRHLVQVLRELRERRFLLRARVLAFRVRVGGLRGFAAARLRDAVRDEVDDVEARHALLLQVVDRVRILLAEDRDEHVRARDFLLAVRRRLHVHDRPLDHALKAERRLRVDIVGAGNGRRVVVDEIAQVLTQVLDVRRARAQHLGCRRIIQQGQQKMLDRNELMPRLARFHERHVQADFQFLGNHASSITHCSGCPACRAWVTTCSTLVDAMSRV